MRNPGSPRPAWQLMLLAGFFIVLFDNLAFWHALSGVARDGLAESVLLFGPVFIAMLAVCMILISLFAWSRLLKPVLILLLILAAATDYYMYRYGVIFDKAMIHNLFGTDRAEAIETMSSPSLWWHITLAGLLPGLVIAGIQTTRPRLSVAIVQHLLIVFLALLALGGVAALRFKELAIIYRENREMLCQVNPICPLVSLTKYVYRMNRETKALIPVAVDAKQATPSTPRKPRLVVMVVGETARAASFSLNGYTRETNPLLQKAQVYNFINVHACGTATLVSLPCMFSNLGRAGLDRDPATYENLLDVVARAGVDVVWRENDAGCKGICTRVRTDDFTGYEDTTLCQQDNCYDEILLQDMDKLLDSDGRDRLLVLHQKGSHGPAYYRRYPAVFRKFQPECTHVDVETCSREQIVNSYDNSILYTDYMLNRTIEMLQRHTEDYNAVMLYVSDHGESLGENGLYLHGLPYIVAPDEQTHVPLLFWFNDHFMAESGLQHSCLQARLQTEWSHDNLFDTVLGLLDIQTRDYRPALDMLAGCYENGTVSENDAGSVL